MIAIFVAEVIAMIVVYFFKSVPYQITVLIDASIMLVMITPVLYFFSFHPLIRHIEKRQRAEQALRQVNRALSVLNECNQVLVHTEQETDFLQKMCEIIVNTGEYCMAWIGFAEQDQARSVHPVAQFGFENGYLELAQITWADDERGRGPTGTAIRQGVVQVNQNFLTNPNMTPWRESALLRGYQSSIALPLQDESSTFGALTIYSALPDAFDEEELHLLKELANDLAFGITALRVRAERNQAQEQVREMALFPSLNPDAVLRVDSVGQVSMANQAAEQIGLCVGTQLTDVIPSFHDLDMASCIANGTTQQVQETYLGEHILQWTVRGIPELGLAFLYSSDITLRKQAEDLNRQLSRIVEQTEDTVVVTNCDGTIEYVNPAFERLTGYTRQETLGKTPRILKSGAHENHFYQELWNAILKGEVFQSEIANRKKNSELFYEVKTITPLRDTHGNITHFVATGKDITEHKQHEEDLRRAYDELELRVQRRTEQLRITNSELEEEITERKQAEEALRASEQRLNRSQEIAHLGSWELDLINDRLTWSDEVYKIFGLQPQEFAASYEAFLEAVHPDDRAAVDDAYLSSVQDGKDGYEIEHRVIRRSNGVIRFVHEKCDHFRNEDGQIIRSVGMVHDITERRRAEAALRQSEENFSKAFKSSPAALLISRLADGRFMEVNESYSAIVGYERNELLGQLTTDFNIYLMPTDRQAIVERLQASGSLHNFETKVRHCSGAVRHVVAALELITFNGEACILTHLLDITERKLAEEALRAARDELELRVEERTKELAVANEGLLNEIAEREEIERQLRIQTTAMEAAADGILITDRQGNIQWTNPALAQISGYNREDLIGHSTRVFNSGQHDADYYRQMWGTILSGEVWRGEMTNRRKDGSLYVEEQTITPVRGNESEITQFIAIKQDITERKQAEKEIRERNQKEKILTQTIHTMQLDIARDLHDTIGQNISFLRMKLDYLAEKKTRKKTEMQLELRSMARAANESYDLMRGTLAVLQSESSTDLFRLFTRYAEQIKERSSFEIDFSSQGEPRFMSAKRMRQLFYIFREILNNIEKHANASQVSMAMTWAREALNLVIFDNGSGFDMDKIQYGSHYGLKFMRERAELLNGSMIIRSEVGSGTKIILEIPYE